VLDYFGGGFHTGRGPQLDDAVTDGILVDLLDFPLVAEAAHDGVICYQKRLTTGPIERNVDLVVGPMPVGDRKAGIPVNHLGWIQSTPADVWLGCEIKSMMTEHHKAQRNRRVELNAHALNLHVVNPKAVRTGLCVINAADTYHSHTSGKVNVHGDGRARVKSAIRELSAIPIRTDTTQLVGLDAMCAVVVVVDNVEFSTVKFLGGPPAPADGDRMSYEHFIERSASVLIERFLRP
jgi:hypothetical protein